MRQDQGHGLVSAILAVHIARHVEVMPGVDGGDTGLGDVRSFGRFVVPGKGGFGPGVVRAGVDAHRRGRAVGQAKAVYLERGAGHGAAGHAAQVELQE